MSNEASKDAEQQAARLTMLLQYQAATASSSASAAFPGEHDALMAAVGAADQALAAQSARDARSMPPGPASASSHPLQHSSAQDPWWNAAAANRDPPPGNRSRSPLGPQPYVTKNELSGGLDKLNDRVQASMQRAMSALNCDISTNISESISDFASKVETRMVTMEDRQDRHEQQLLEHDVAVKGIQQQLAALGAQQQLAAGQIRELQAAQTAAAASVAQTTQHVNQVQRAVAAEVRNREETEVAHKSCMSNKQGVQTTAVVVCFLLCSAD